MNSSAKIIFATSAMLRLLTSFAPTTDFLTQAFGAGILPAIRASILDPVHTWDHLEEACFLLQNKVSIWGDDEYRSGYRAIYAPGSRIVAPPLVVAFLGELFAPLKSSDALFWILQRLLLLVADIIGAYCIYQIGKRVYVMENDSIEAEIERDTKNCKMNLNLSSVVPEKIRPARGWIFGLSNQVLDDFIADEKSPADASGNANGMEQQKNGKHLTKLDQSSSRQHLNREPILTLGQVPLLVSLLYFSNPVSMIANSTGSLRSIWDALALTSLYYATKPPSTNSKEGIPIKVESASSAATYLALATYVDVGYATLLVPILLWRGMLRGYYQQKSSMKSQRGQNNDWKSVLTLYICYLIGLHYLASLLVGGDSNEYKSVMVQTMLPNVAFVDQDQSGSLPGPSMGLHWYFFVQMFDRFRPYFTVCVAGVPAMFVIPLTIRLHRYPSVLTATFHLLWAMFRPTTTIHTLTLGLLLAMLNPRTIARMRNASLISLFAIPVPVLLFITFHRMWLVTGNGNPNYIFFQCFAYGLFVSVITLDFVSASVKRDKVLRMVEKGDTIVKKDDDEKVEERPKSNGKKAFETNGIGIG
eukprot:CAMPEP_0201737540 /NCGR_PEP_ID=MMETSP0593-20130828/42634_1 /ASSEMBLY_ACC=CAM_ASM_000672 /TAXON_ID=267983 /ORGANISM="Skeletonema japonicum, Strain CCMP2506" /LENGTH=586 /DNA_ID=CAMNT_0048231533 /DNA_START=77 /DNA_END=1833 /DNA_ORIENTATION=+